MILISINPFALRRFFLVLIFLVVLSCVSAWADSLLVTVKRTPYDLQMQRVRPVLNTERRTQSELSLALVNHWIGDLRSIPYGFTREWKTPTETESGAPADCKAKAVDLYQRMLAHGATDVRLVIGKRSPTSRSTHAWLEWETRGSTYVLDPTINWMAYRTRDLDATSYVPYYAYAGNHKYRAVPGTLVAKN